MKYLQKQLQQKKNKIVWLASYPKSGNTWFRCFLSALFTGKVDLAKLETDGIASSRVLFDHIVGIDSRLLVEEEVHCMLPEVLRQKSKLAPKLQFIKVHDAYILNAMNEPIFPTDITHKVIYLVRNPLDIVGSLANHNATSIERTIHLMNNPKGYLGGFIDGLNNNIQFQQLMLSWSGHVKSWTEQEELDVIVIKYEELKHNTINTFTDIIKALEIEASDEQIKAAIDLTAFEKLQEKEKQTGFKEKNIRSKSFFRSGKTGMFKNELTSDQIRTIKEHHHEVMHRLGYLD